MLCLLLMHFKGIQHLYYQQNQPNFDNSLQLFFSQEQQPQIIHLIYILLHQEIQYQILHDYINHHKDICTKNNISKYQPLLYISICPQNHKYDNQVDNNRKDQQYNLNFYFIHFQHIKHLNVVQINK
ncbi:unnamed protein product [Paramecium sonneborni]|uniref:Uncharacterized protein n=1 Tax=Paramecium sonneborni TaxID=65129 RepID=A0A8S1RLB8_9CILI|nr:unnamed protein product [Paramecium sonneborni]